jgi:hypothetical protein
MSCVAIYKKLNDFHCPRIVSSHITPYHRHRLVRRYAPQLDAVVGDQNLATGGSIIFHRRFRPSTDPFSSCKRSNSHRLPLKIDFFFPLLLFSWTAGKAIFTFIITFITFIVYVVINVIFRKYWSFWGFLLSSCPGLYYSFSTIKYNKLSYRRQKLAF